MKTMFLLVLLSFVPTTAMAVQRTPPTLDPSIQVTRAPTPTKPAEPATERAAETATKKTTLIGKLEKGRVAVGGETTGWILHYRVDAKPQTIEVDFGKEFAGKGRHGATVRVTGTLVARNYVERGTVSVLVVSDLEEIAAPK